MQIGRGGYTQFNRYYFAQIDKDDAVPVQVLHPARRLGDAERAQPPRRGSV